MAKPRNHEEYLRSVSDADRTILEKVRKAVLKACPDAEETIKWNRPHFEKNGILLGMSAFKHHVGVHVWRVTELSQGGELFDAVGNTSMGTLRVTKPSELPSQATLVRIIKEVAGLNEAAVKGRSGQAKRHDAESMQPPADLSDALKKNKKALKTFEGFSYTNRKEYVDWIEGAKREATRERRVKLAVETMAQGKPRNWKYMREWK